MEHTIKEEHESIRRLRQTVDRLRGEVVRFEEVAIGTAATASASGPSMLERILPPRRLLLEARVCMARMVLATEELCAGIERAIDEAAVRSHS